MKNILILSCFLLNLNFVFCTNDTIGSDSVPSRQAHYNFSGNNNRIAGFAGMEHGFSFQDQNTTCTFDSTFPVNYFVNLNNGILFLNTHLNYEENLEFPTAANIYCNDYNIEFPQTYESNKLIIPSIGNMAEVDNTTLASTSYDLDWSYDDKYIAINSGTNLQIYYFNDNSITLTASITAVGTIYSLEWQPNNYKIAVGTSGSSNTLSVYEWNNNNGTLTLVDNISPGTLIRSVSWHPTGKHIACLRSSSSELYIYSFNGTSLSFLTSIDIPGGTRSSYISNLLSWRPDGKYLASGYYLFTGQPELYVHSFNGSTLALNASAEINNYVISLDWSPTNSLIAVGLWSTTENLRVFEHNATINTLTELTTARIGITQTVRDVNWRSDGKYLCYAKYSGTGNEYQTLYLDKNAETLNSATGYNIASGSPYAIEWSNNQNYIATCDSNRNFQIFGFTFNSSYINNGNLIINSDVNLKNTLVLRNKCQIDGNNNKIFLGNTGSIFVDSNSTLTLKNVIFEDISSGNLRCRDNTGTIFFDNITLNLSDDSSFRYGKFEIENILKISGPYTYSYQTILESKIHANSTLKLKNGSIFSYQSNSNNNNLITLQDSTSQIYLNESSLHSTTTGIQLTKGTLKIKGSCFIDSDATTKAEAIKVGDGIRNENNLNINIEPESNLNLLNGYLEYKNVN